jgi:coenzyme F420 hydrogenase subunit beta
MSGKSFLSRPEAKSYESLFNEIIRAGRCMKCGACVASCPYKVLTIDNKAEMPILVKECVSCQVCYYQCPRVEFPIHQVEKYVFDKSFEQKGKLGVYISINTGRSKKEDILRKCEDGGIISSLVAYALNTKKADSAILTCTHELLPWKAHPVVATTQEEVAKNAGSKYSISPTIMGLSRAAEDYMMKKIVLVGLPCQIQALRRMQTTPLKAPSNISEQVTLAISLVCMESYVYDEFLYSLFIQKGIDPATVSKFSIKRGKFRIYVRGEEKVSLPLKEIKPLMNAGCQICSDYSGEYADISVGAIGSEIGWSTILTRTKKGEELLRGAVKEGYIELKALREEGPSYEFLLKEADRKKQRAMRNQTTPT